MFNLCLILIPAFPLAAAILTAITGRALQERCRWISIVAIGLSFVCSVILALHVRDGVAQASAAGEGVGYEHVVSLWTWAAVTDTYDQASALVPTASDAAKRDMLIDVALRADGLTAIMLCMVTFVATLVAIYAGGYMHGDPGYWRFFSYVSLFVFSMTMLVSVSNFVLLYVFWEAVGVCSYLLIGFWYEKPEAATAGKKAFLVNRVGDFGFALALFLIWTCYGTLNFHDTAEVNGVFGQARLATGDFVTGWPAFSICCLLLIGACGKSAQFPLHVWLPDAMEGPTPVSALIHAATMVTAGIYMITRCTPLFMVSPDAQMVVACVGGITAIMAGIIAITQNDLKRILAYSTVSQLGYMFLALGVGSLAGIAAGMFHLFTHAFFKALLFLGAGSVMHAMGGVIDIRRFGGLRRMMPITCLTFAFGSLALAGIFPFAGFWSKDAIVGAVHDQVHEIDHVLAERSAAEEIQQTRAAFPLHTEDGLVLVASPAVGAQHDGHEDGSHGVQVSARVASLTDAQLARGKTVYGLLYYAALITAFLTAVYTFRAFFLTFFGDEEIPHEAGHHAHESPPSMWIPLAILAVGAGCIGFAAEWSGGLSADRPHLFSDALATTPSLAYSAAQETTQPGVFHKSVAIMSSVVALLGVAVAAFLFLGDQKEASVLARLLDFVPGGLSPYELSRNKFYWDEIYDWLIVKPVHGLAAATYAIDRWVVDGLVDFVAWVPKAVGGVMRGLQVGLVPFYGLAMVLGVLTLLAARILWGNS